MARKPKNDEAAPLKGAVSAVLGGLERVDDDEGDEEPHPKVMELLQKLETITNADQCREVIATAARYHLTGLLKAPQERTFREAALGALKAIEVAARTNTGQKLTAAGDALVAMAEFEEEKRERTRKRRRNAARKAESGAGGT